ncbi:MAG: hypothetical protein MI923_27410 [Phycisphaerales bacterium]|nr:hypothetical protein [Phycisphaerales bacterium]
MGNGFVEIKIFAAVGERVLGNIQYTEYIRVRYVGFTDCHCPAPQPANG